MSTRRTACVPEPESLMVRRRAKVCAVRPRKNQLFRVRRWDRNAVIPATIVDLAAAVPKVVHFRYRVLTISSFGESADRPRDGRVRQRGRRQRESNPKRRFCRPSPDESPEPGESSLRVVSPEPAHPLPTDSRSTDPDLAALVAAWPTLPEPVRAGILALIEASKPKRGRKRS